MVYERPHQPLLPRTHFAVRVLKGFAVSGGIIFGSLAIGVVGYMHFGRMGLVDGIYNASMILTGMGPVDHVETDAGKLFASFYALFSGIAFLSSVGVLIAPVVHRFLHRFHLELDEEN